LLRFDEITPARIAEIQANAGKGSAFRRRVDALASLPSVEAAFRELTRDPALAAEARLHLGYLRLIQGDAQGALTHLEGLPGKGDDAFIGHLAHYFRGWAWHRLEERDRAIEAYQAAVALMPGARIASTLLAEQLFFDDRRDDAYALLDRTFTSPAPAYEALVWFKRGGARFIPDQIAAMREAIR
jgi:tetratricopeptide (TPR) repeat protein